MSFNAKDFLLLSMVERCGGSVLLVVPDDLTQDEKASLRNACMIPGVRASFHGGLLGLVLVPEGEEQLLGFPWESSRG